MPVPAPDRAFGRVKPKPGLSCRDAPEPPFGTTAVPDTPRPVRAHESAAQRRFPDASAGSPARVRGRAVADIATDRPRPAPLRGRCFHWNGSALKMREVRRGSAMSLTAAPRMPWTAVATRGPGLRVCADARADPRSVNNLALRGLAAVGRVECNSWRGTGRLALHHRAGTERGRWVGKCHRSVRRGGRRGRCVHPSDNGGVAVDAGFGQAGVSLVRMWSMTGVCSAWGLNRISSASRSTRTLWPGGQWKTSLVVQCSVVPSL